MDRLSFVVKERSPAPPEETALFCCPGCGAGLFAGAAVFGEDVEGGVLGCEACTRWLHLTAGQRAVCPNCGEVARCGDALLLAEGVPLACDACCGGGMAGDLLAGMEDARERIA